MVVPVLGRALAAVADGGLVLAVWASVIGTLIVPRAVGGWPTRWVATGLVIVTLQIAYLPTLYAAFNRRENEIALLNSRAGACRRPAERLVAWAVLLGAQR